MAEKRYRISVDEVTSGDDTVRIYEQLVDIIDLKAIQNAVNKKPRTRKKKGEIDGK